MIHRAAAKHETRTPAGKAAYLEALLPVLVKIDSAVERAAWLPRIAERGGLDEAAAREELRRALRGGRGPVGAVGGSAAEAAPLPGPVRAQALIPAERLLLGLLLRSAAGVDEALGELGDAEIDGLHSAPVLRAARSLYLKNVAITSAALTEAVEEEARTLLTAVAMVDGPSDGVSPLDCVKELKRILIRARMKEVQRALKEAPADEHEALLTEKGELARRLAAVG